MKIRETGNEMVDIWNYQHGKLDHLTPDTELKRLVIEHKKALDSYNEVTKRLYDKEQVKKAIEKDVISELDKALNIN